MDPNLTTQVAQWHEADDHQRIVDTITEIPPQERTYDIISSLGRAYNNLGRYEEGLEQFGQIAEQGANDLLWHYRTGYAYYYLKRYKEAEEAFRAVLALDPADGESARYLEWIRHKLEKEERTAAQRELSRKRRNSAPAAPPFEGMDLSDFWDDSSYALEAYVSDPPSDELITSVEEELGYKLPESYIALMKQHNGGAPRRTCYPTDQATSWAEDHIAITSILGIGREKDYSLCGDLGSRFMIEDWGYPDIGVVICDCPSAGHDVVMLDYSHCGKDGEPEVIHVDQEDDYEITYLAPDFETFIRGLVDEEEYDTSAEDKEEDLRKVTQGQFSPLLAELCGKAPDVEHLESLIRTVCTRVVEEKGYFSFHADELSLLMYDVQFWLYSNAYPQPGREKYLEVYSQMIAFGGEFGQGGYAPGFISDWLDRRIKEGRIVQRNGGLAFTEQAREDVIEQLKATAAEAGEKAADVLPFKLVEQANGGMSVILVAGSYLTELFESRADEGFEGNGYDWASLAAVFLEEEMPQLLEQIHFDPEADMFCAYSSNGAALKEFAIRFRQACGDETRIRELFARAELD